MINLKVMWLNLSGRLDVPAYLKNLETVASVIRSSSDANGKSPHAAQLIQEFLADEKNTAVFEHTFPNVTQENLAAVPSHAQVFVGNLEKWVAQVKPDDVLGLSDFMNTANIAPYNNGVMREIAYRFPDRTLVALSALALNCPQKDKDALLLGMDTGLLLKIQDRAQPATMVNFFRNWMHGQEPDVAKEGLLKSTTLLVQASNSAFVQEVNNTSASSGLNDPLRQSVSAAKRQVYGAPGAYR